MHPVDSLAKRLSAGASALPFQRRVYDAIAAGRNVVLQAPTGAGKTFAALAPFLAGAWGRSTGKPATKLIYSLPLRSLAGSLREQYAPLFPDVRFTTQYGGAAEDLFLDEGQVIFTTIDQTLSAFLGVPLSVPKRLANTVFGSVLSAALVFDETHLLDPDRSFGTALHLLRQSPWPVLIMTATMSTGLCSELCRFLDAERITVGVDDLPQVRSQYGTEKYLHVSEQPLNGTGLAAQLGARTIVLCNRVSRAQEVYADLCRELKRTDNPALARAMLLHSRFLPEHRQQKETLLRTWFGELASERAVLVTTQVVEAGLDISCDVMHTEVSPIDSFIQRIGRAARFATQQRADVHLYPVPDMDTANGCLPYKRGQLIRSLDALKQRQMLVYEDLQPLIDPILGPEQAQLVERIERDAMAFRERVHQVRRVVEKAALREFVRDINSIELVVADVQAVSHRETSLYDYPAISLPVGTVQSFLRKGGQAWREKGEVGLVPVEGADVSNARLLVPPSEAYYDPETGLELNRPGHFVFQPQANGRSKLSYAYEQESYADHLRRLLNQRAVREAPLAALHRLMDRGLLPPVRDPEKLIALVIWAHDIAKLSDGWQEAHNVRPDAWEPLAHGGRQPGRKPPPHAVEGAFAVGRLFAALLHVGDGEAPEVCCAALDAVRTHHSPVATNPHRFKINKERRAYLRQVTPVLLPTLGAQILDHFNTIHWELLHDEKVRWPDAGPAYDALLALLSYMLRRSDQLATAEVSTLVSSSSPTTTDAI